jgi:hypothetical protein
MTVDSVDISVDVVVIGMAPGGEDAAALDAEHGGRDPLAEMARSHRAADQLCDPRVDRVALPRIRADRYTNFTEPII